MPRTSLPSSVDPRRVMGLVRCTAVPLGLMLAALLTAVALAANGDPQKKFTAADQARAKAVALSHADLGAGWKAEKSGGNESSPRCSYYNPDQSDLVETGHGDTSFTRGTTLFVASSVGIFKTAGQAKAGYARVVRPQLPRCLGEIFAKGTGNPKAVKIVSTGPLSFPHYRDRSNAYRVTATFKTSSGTVPITIDTVLVNRGRIDVVIGFIGVGKPPAASLERSLAGKVAGRMS